MIIQLEEEGKESLEDFFLDCLGFFSPHQSQ